jgi:hypothetical protein
MTYELFLEKELKAAEAEAVLLPILVLMMRTENCHTFPARHFFPVWSCQLLK